MFWWPTCDKTLPVFTAAEIHYGLGYVRLFFSETVDITPEGLFDLSNIYIVDETGVDEPDAVPPQEQFSTQLMMTNSFC